VGSTSIAKVRAYAAAYGLSFFSAAQACIAETGLLPAKARSGLAEFCGTIEAGRHFTGDLADVVQMIIEKSGLIRALEAENTVAENAKTLMLTERKSGIGQTNVRQRLMLHYEENYVFEIEQDKGISKVRIEL
jgi:DNA helicase-2/ATP-dependent DNA helicase PcrA